MKRIWWWLDARLSLSQYWRQHFTEYYVPKNLNVLYIFGALALFVLLNQLGTGIWLTMFYIPTPEQAYDSIQNIMRNVNFGWLLRYLHTTGASAFFIVIYLHLFRGLVYGSYKAPREIVWILGMILYILLLAIAFLGYLLPWGQMSYWGAEVFTSLLGSIPYLGDSLMLWVRGDYSISGITLQRFFALHVIALPLCVFLFTALHIVALRKVGANNPEGFHIQKPEETIPENYIPFFPYYFIKDLLGLIGFLLLFSLVVFFMPNMGGYFLEANNYIPANSLITPNEIKPMWYVAPYYAMLRAIPDKVMGLLLTGCAFAFLFILPWLDQSPVRSMRYKGVYSRTMLAVFVSSFILLGYCGLKPLNEINLWFSRIALLGYFSYFLMMPWYTRRETCRPIPCEADS
ncbi:MAG: cytochrome b [Legionella sp. 40-6]|nr:cytochrome bc complex cytochrome b subunit [Legionella sp.]OJY40193.1 MAG: cytochrome b [Legionella sp. 40-6]